MKKTFAFSMIALGALVATPVMAQGVYVGPGGVGVDTGLRHHRYYDSDRDYGYRDRGAFEGRSAYRDGYRRRSDRYDD